MDASIVIKSYTVGDIEELLADKNFWELDPLPITKQRIVSKMRNPRADKADLALAAAYENGRVVGFAGVFSDLVFIDGMPRKAGCLTTKWVVPEKRRQGISTALREVVLKAYDGMIYVSEMSEPARKTIEVTNKFTALKPMKFNQLRIRITLLDGIRKRFPQLRKLDALFSAIEMLANLPVRARLALWKVFNRLDETRRVEYLAETDPETARFIQIHQENNMLRRGAPELDWITRYPWVLQAPMPDVTTPKFFFSTVAKSFSYIKYRILDSKGQIRAFVLLRLRDGRLHIPYAYCDESDADAVARLLCHQIIELGAVKFETCNEKLVERIRKLKFPILTISVRDRHSFLTNKLAGDADLEALCLQDGDGDKVFT